MFIFGWGKKNKSWSFTVKDVPMQLVCVWNYFNIMFIFGFIFNKKYFLLADKRSDDRELTYAEVKKLFPENTPDASFWDKYGLLIGIGLLFVLGFAGAFN